MKPTFYITLLLFILSFTSSCTVEKRLYNKGYSISFRKSIHSSSGNLAESAKVESNQVNLSIENETLVESLAPIITSDSTVAEILEESKPELAASQISEIEHKEVLEMTLSSRKEKLENLKSKSKTDFTGTYFTPDTYAVIAHCGFALMAAAVAIAFAAVVVDPWLLFFMAFMGFGLNLTATIEGLITLRTEDPIHWWFTKISLYFYLGMYLAVIFGGVIFVLIEES